MKGLLLKDWYMILKNCRMFFVIVLVFTAASAFGSEDGALFFSLYPVLIASMISITLMAYDEKSKWNIYCDILPCSRRAAVSEKYILAALSLFVCLGASAVSQLIRMFSLNQVDYKGFVSLMEMLLMVGLLAPALMLPVVFRFGTEKGRLLYYILIGGIAVLFAVLGKINPDMTVSGSFFSSLSGVGVAAVVILFLSSWRLSVAFYEKREL